MMIPVTDTPDPDTPEPAAAVETLADLPFHVVGRFPKPLLVGRCLSGAVQGLSSQEVFERIRDLSLGLAALGIGPGDRVAVVSESRPEWLMADLAILARGAVNVPVYPTLSAAQARYILDDSSARMAIVSTASQLEKVDEVRRDLPRLETLVVMDGAGSAASQAISLADLAERGHARLAAEWGAGRVFTEGARLIAPDQLATIIYTSGTTGDPKGVMLTHGNLVANMQSASTVLSVTQDDVALSFLPLSHAFERMVAYVYLLCGVTIVFAESLETIARDIGVVRPTLLTGVPRVYEKLHARVMEKGAAGSGLKVALFRWAIRMAMARGGAELRGRTLGPLASVQATLADRLVFSKIRDGVGGRIRYLISGSAPLAANIAEFFQGIGLPIIEGYGLTETAPILTVNPPDAPRVGTVGKPLPDVDLRIAADGEILARGPNIMRGYYNKPDATAEALRDGWFHTGDIGTIDGQGYVTITDRKKDLLVTSGGKNVAPQPIEAALKRDPLVNEAVLLGDRRKFVAAMIVPDFPALERRLEELRRPRGTREDLVRSADVLALYQETVDAVNRELSQYERIRKFALLPAEFSIQTGELTPTLKVKRKVVEERWRGIIDELYAS